MPYLLVVVVVVVLLLGAAIGFGSCGGAGGGSGGTGADKETTVPTAESTLEAEDEHVQGLLVKDRAIFWDGESVSAEEAARKAKATGSAVRVNVDPSARMGTVAALERALRDAGVTADTVDLPR